MQSEIVIEALLALAQETRLAAYRLLVRAGSQGLPAGEIASALSVNPSTMSRHLAQLERAKLLHSWRIQRQVFYAIDWDGTGQLLKFLTEDCCRADSSIWYDGESGNCRQ
ncbi:helix-turn-helix transcriptional regulator [Chroococcidiopsis sp. CCNUC1]|uniref:ArsR/SmtB family transcription factor n=1 Tax=Chroococcidiopsis sp. CCNUC1 TaxID=2653189 RepID=UPI0020227514|nr:helix-turn-helix domain-containing protein [Chroococcidiopsis sp. CCNUC1]URD49031.1 helix-turn-helix domain-containing protein [Chroococcidiopsis sp. CCNUC1]